MLSDLLCVAAAVLVALLIRHDGFELVRIKGSSMLGTLHNGEVTLVDRFSWHFAPPERGQVIICRYPGRYVYWRGHKLFRQYFVKRLIGLPGDTLEIIAGVVHINGVPLDEPYLDPVRTRRLYDMSPITLAEDEYFVLGDNRDSSNDSRRVGTLHREALVGRVRRVLIPWRSVR